MAIGLQQGERVFVPASVLNAQVNSSSAFWRSGVLQLNGRSVQIDVGAGNTEWVAASKCQRSIGVAVLAIGDFASEATLIDPLSKSVLQFCRLLCSDDYVRAFKIRSVAELSLLWAQNHAVYSHVTIIGHGNGTGLKFAADDWVPPEDLRASLDIQGVTKKCFVNLSCELGKAAYGKSFSKLDVCEAFIGPFDSVHGAVGLHFVQSFLVNHLLHGETLKVAFRHARETVAGSTSFRMWRKGKMITGD